ncbi:MAG: Mut7-C RNAse domain-containing protein [Deltaproteobacteria bacterium]|nr:Mut7-C RNAse domain-containing protein [Deltaproteobacteria bacterium]
MSGAPRRLIADAMLGKLARWLRTLGYDCAFEPDITDDDLIKRAVEEGREILTRDTLLIQRRAVRGRAIFIESDLVVDQLKELSKRFEINAAGFLTRCLRCNIPLEPMNKEAARDKVPPYVFATQERFSVCTGCSRIYWGGTHKARMIEAIERMLKGIEG